jgi:hypothetical protein
MPADNKLELIVEVDFNKANASIKSISTGPSSMEQAAGKAPRGAPAGIDGLTVSMVNGLRTMGIFVDLNKEVDRQEKLTEDTGRKRGSATPVQRGDARGGRGEGQCGGAGSIGKEATRTGRRS